MVNRLVFAITDDKADHKVGVASVILGLSLLFSQISGNVLKTVQGRDVM